MSHQHVEQLWVDDQDDNMGLCDEKNNNCQFFKKSYISM